MKKSLISLVLVIVGVTIGSAVFSLNVFAADARNFNPGRIIDDSVFTNSSSMSIADIQNFLNSKVQCDTWGQEQSELGGGTRAQWMAARGISPPFRCIRDYYENPSNGESNYSRDYIPAGALSAAHIISNYSIQFGINPQVILATLQKENGLITDEWPTPKNYRESMGFGCPDNIAAGAPACDPAYGSFSAQIYQAARHFRGYFDAPPGWWVSFNTGNNTVKWNPQSWCGSSTVYIENRATVALYTYTPYRPNQAALNAQYGRGDDCSSYGNRNFYLYFTDWFGSVYSGVSIASPLRVSSVATAGYYTKSPTTVSFDIRNTTGAPINIGGMTVAMRNSSGANFDYPLRSMTIPAYSTATYQESQVLPAVGEYSMWISNLSNNSWKNDYPVSGNSTYPRAATISVTEPAFVTSSLSIQGGPLRVGKDSAINFAITNNGSTTVNAGKIGVGIRGPSGENYDLPMDSVSLSPGQTYTFGRYFRPVKEGAHSLYIISTLNSGNTWETTYPISQNSSIQRSLSSTVQAGQTVVGGLMADTPDLRVGRTTQLSFKVKNYSSVSVDLGKLGIIGRDPAGRNVDPGIAAVTLAAGEERTISFPITPQTTGRYTFEIIATRDNGATWEFHHPKAEDASIVRWLPLESWPGVVITGSPALSTSSPHVGESYTISYKVKNYSSSSVNMGKLGLSGRDPQWRNVDPGVIDVVLAAGEERTISFPNRPQSALGEYRYGIIATPNNGVSWNDGPPAEGTGVVKNATVNLKSNVTVTQGIQSSNGSVKAGQSTTLTFKVKNFSTDSVNMGKLGLSGRDPQWRNVDPGVIDVTLAPGEERTISFPITLAAAGTYRYTLLSTADNGATWQTGPASETSNIVRNLDVTVSP